MRPSSRLDKCDLKTLLSCPAQAAAPAWAPSGCPRLESLPWAPLCSGLHPMNSFCHWLNAAALLESLINFSSCLRLYLLQRKQGNPCKLNRSKLTACSGASLERIIAPWLRGTEEKNEHGNLWQRFWLALWRPGGSHHKGRVCDGVSINGVSQHRIQGKLLPVLNQHYLPQIVGPISLSYPLSCPPPRCMPFHSRGCILAWQ